MLKYIVVKSNMSFTMDNFLFKPPLLHINLLRYYYFVLPYSTVYCLSVFWPHVYIAF